MRRSGLAAALTLAYVGDAVYELYVRTRCSLGLPGEFTGLDLSSGFRLRGKSGSGRPFRSA